MYLNGMGLRGIERVTDIHHTTVMGWVKEAGLNLPDVPEADEEPEITDLHLAQKKLSRPCIEYIELVGEICVDGRLNFFKPSFLDELQTFVGNKRHKVWLWTAVNHWQPGIIAWTIGDRSSLTFQLLWVVVK